MTALRLHSHNRVLAIPMPKLRTLAQSRLAFLNATPEPNTSALPESQIAPFRTNTTRLETRRPLTRDHDPAVQSPCVVAAV